MKLKLITAAAAASRFDWHVLNLLLLSSVRFRLLRGTV